MSWHKKGEHPTRRRWAKVRLQALDRDSWACVRCGHKGKCEVDHRIPLDVAPDRMYDLSNLQVLCRSCHFSKTRGEKTGRGPSPEVEEWKRYLTNSLLACIVIVGSLWAC